ncbi:ATP-binding domain-containing protein [Burkholderia gladioli]|uniref:ATP-binding domain-containing protein n=1 Tax=Burkholderia gladioli TaxID=28095 RepID=UPI0013749FF5|nr:ATP-binding domain-containing protein [Burkholderia gladioli]
MSGTWWVDEGELLDEQADVLEVDLYEDLMLSGPPGSGKTNLLLLRANHLVLTSPDKEFYIICFTSLLQNFIRTGAGLYAFPENRIITQYKLYEQVLADHGFAPPRKKNESYNDRIESLKSALASMMNEGIGKHAYPVLFIDEAQDYSGEDLEIFKYLAANLTCAGDSRQGIYSVGETGVSWIADHPWDKKISLQYHHRVAPAILEVGDKMMDGKFGHQPMLETHQYKGDPGSIEVVPGITLDEQIKTMIPKLGKQLALYPNQIIGVLVPQKEDVPRVVELLSADPTLAGRVTNAVSQYFDSTAHVWVSTVHSAKGLEFRCVHIVAADLFRKFLDHERRVAFMAVTRAKTTLTIYHEKPLHAFFAAALAKPNPAKVTTRNLFGKAS